MTLRLLGLLLLVVATCGELHAQTGPEQPDTSKQVFLPITDVNASWGTVSVRGDYDTLADAGTSYRIFAPPGIETRGAAAGLLEERWVAGRSSRCLYAGYRYEAPLAGLPSWTGASPSAVARQTGKNFAGLHYTLHRHYDPVLMRFTSPDPIASPFYNLNHYAGNNPSAFYDPDGLERRTGGAYGGAMEAMDLWGLFGGAKEAMKRDTSAGEVASAFADDVQNTDWQTVGASASYGGLNTVSGGWFGEFVSAESYASATGANVGSNEWRAGYAMGATVTGAVVAALPGGATFMGAAHLSHGAYNAGRAIGGDSSITPGEVYGDLAAGVGLFGHGMRGARSSRSKATPSAPKCFIAGTQVLVQSDDGETAAKAIEEIEVGDLVWSRDDQTGEEGFKPVVRLFRNESDTLVHLTYTTPTATETLTGTPEHPFWSIDDGAWNTMAELQVGERLLLSTGNTATVTATRTERLDSATKVYNFEVAHWHTYYVGSDTTGWVWTHNLCGAGKRRVRSLLRHGVDARDAIRAVKSGKLDGAGIYEFVSGSNGPLYVGQSGNMFRRMKEHLRKGRLTPGQFSSIQTTHMPGSTKIGRLIAEQNRVNYFRRKRIPLDNKINPIARLYWALHGIGD